jgi:protein-S-isoprenylcysteine O-methyltransferase Ste14
MSAPQDHGPGVRIPPPVMAAGVLAVAWVLDRIWTLRIGPPLPELGGMVIFLGIALCGWAVLVLVKAGNDPRPHKPDNAMVEAGPFRFSRNPIYLGFLLGAAGVALVWGTLWGWVAVAVLHGLLDRLVIAKEEAYLAGRFGAPYEAYQARVRRWM